jgi:hypothetical protein
MPSKALESLVLLLLVLVASAGGCADAAAPTGNGRLDLTVMPESLIASGRPLQGSFELRGLDRATSVTVAVDGAGYQTRSVALAPGVYSLRWHPHQQPGDVSKPPALEAADAAASAIRTVVIASNRVTSLTVHSTINTPEVPQPVAAVAPSPEPSSRSAAP